MKLLFENWRKYLKEGKAIAANQSMHDYTKSAWRAYHAAGKEGKLKFNQPFFSAAVDGYDGEKIEVEMQIVKIPETANFNPGSMGVAGSTAGTQNQTIKIFQTREGIHHHDFKMWKPSVLHELTHVIDPKFKLDPEEHPWRRTYKYGTEEYAVSPHEIDALIRSSVEDAKIWPWGEPITTDLVRNYKPREWYEKIWYEKHPKIWKKLINSLYAERDDK
jgi:hypothetical protein